MELRQLQYVVTLAEELHFGRAAARHYITHGALSQQISRLERELQVRLFDRDSRHVELTPAGRLLLEHARKVTAAVDAAAVAVREHREGRRGALRLGLLAAGGGEIANEMMRAFCLANPEAQLVPSDLMTTDLIAPLLDGRLDASLVWGPIDDERLEVTPLFTEPRVAVLSPRNERADADSLMVADLLGMPHLQRLVGEPERWEGFWNLVPERGGEQPDRHEWFQTGNVVSQLRSVGLNDGLLTTPASCIRDLPAAALGVCYVPVTDLEPTPLSLVALRNPANPLVAAFRRVALSVTGRLLSVLPDDPPRLHPSVL